MNVIHFSLTLWINIWYKLLLVFIFPTFLSWRTISAVFENINHIHLDFQKNTIKINITMYIYTYMISSASLYLIKYKKRFGFATSHRTKKKMQSRQTLQLFQLGYLVLWSLAPCHEPVINGGITGIIPISRVIAPFTHVFFRPNIGVYYLRFGLFNGFWLYPLVN